MLNQSVALGLGIILNVVVVAPLVIMGGIGLWMRVVELVAWLKFFDVAAGGRISPLLFAGVTQAGSRTSSILTRTGGNRLSRASSSGDSAG